MARQSTSPDTRRREANIAKEESGAVTWYVKTTADGGDNTSDGRSPSAAVATLQKAHDLAAAGDKIVVFPGQLGDTVLVTISKSVTIIGLGGRNGFRGASYIEMEGAGVEGMLVTADDVTLINLGVSGDDTADYSLQVGTQAISPARFRAYDCKFEGVETAGAGQLVLKGAGDVLLVDCEFAWGTGGLMFDDNDEGFCTQVRLINPHFHNLTEVHVGALASGGVVNFTWQGGTCDRLEDGTAPTDFVKVSRAGDTGLITGVSFAHATNAVGVFEIAAGIMWVANKTEAGVTTARPA